MMSKGERTVTFLPSVNETPIKTNRVSFCNMLGYVVILGVIITLGFYTGLYVRDQRMESALATEELLLAQSSGNHVPPEESNLEFQLPYSNRLNHVRKRRDVTYFGKYDSSSDSSEPILRVRYVAEPKVYIGSQKMIPVAVPFKPSFSDSVKSVSLT